MIILHVVKCPNCLSLLMIEAIPLLVCEGIQILNVNLTRETGDVD